MPTKTISKALLGAVAAAALAAPAFAGGNCASGQCSVPVQVMDGYAPQFGPMTVRNVNPMGHLRSVQFQRAPNVSITRIHGMMPTANLSDAPSGFTDGCHPTSTTYCRQDMGASVQVDMAPRPTYTPAPQPVYSAPAPVVMAPAEPRVVAIGGGYDPSKFAPRTYGDATFVPGIAHLPTSIVDRSPARAQQVLDSGRTVSQPVLGRDTFGGTAPHMGMVAPQVRMPASVTIPVIHNRAPAMGMTYSAPQQMRAPGYGYGQPGAPVLQQSGPMAGAYGSTVAGDGTYWEKVSGPTAMGNTIATSVICKRQLPSQTVRPVIGVPTPVPYAVPQGCQTVKVPGGRYGHSERGRWTH